MGKSKHPEPAECGTCRALLMFVRIGRGWLPVRLRDDPAGHIAAHRGSGGTWIGRWLAAGEHPAGYERRFAVHEHRADGSLATPRDPDHQPDLFTAT